LASLAGASAHLIPQADRAHDRADARADMDRFDRFTAYDDDLDELGLHQWNRRDDCVQGLTPLGCALDSFAWRHADRTPSYGVICGSAGLLLVLVLILIWLMRRRASMRAEDSASQTTGLMALLLLGRRNKDKPKRSNSGGGSSSDTGGYEKAASRPVSSDGYAQPASYYNAPAQSTWDQSEAAYGETRRRPPSYVSM